MATIQDVKEFVRDLTPAQRETLARILVGPCGRGGAIELLDALTPHTNPEARD